MSFVKIVEVGPRDGLQNEKIAWSIEDRVTLINLLSQCPFREIEVGSFVSPKWIPQMAGTEEVFRKIDKKPRLFYSCLVPNHTGLMAALEADVQQISVFTSASDVFTQKNIHCDVEESLNRFSPLISLAIEKGVRVRGYVSCVIECPYSGKMDPSFVTYIAHRLLTMGCMEIALGDTTGKGTPETIDPLIETVCQDVPVEKLAIHCHDTYGQAMGSILTAIERGVRVVDSSIGGLGGCPYAGGHSAGNVSTEKVVDVLSKKGYLPPFDQDLLKKASDFVKDRSLFYRSSQNA